MNQPILQLPAANSPGDRRSWGNLRGSSPALAIVEAALSAKNKLSVLITDTAKTASRLEAEITFFARSENLPILHFPDWETLPYDAFSPHQDIVSTRLSALSRLPTTRGGILVVPVTTLMHKLPPSSYVSANSFAYTKGDSLDLAALRLKLDSAGYRAVATVYEHGEYAVRGSLVDIFPMGSNLPIRIDLFDDEIDSLRSFDPETQVSQEPTEDISLLPAREFPLDKQGVKTFLDNWHAHFDVDPRDCPVYQDVKNGRHAQGLEYYLPLFFQHTATLFDYLPTESLIFTDGDLAEAAEHFWKEVTERFEEYSADRQRPLLAPSTLYLNSGEMFSHFSRYGRTDLTPLSAPAKPHHFNAPTAEIEDLAVDSRADKPLARLEQQLLNTPHRTLFSAESAGRKDALLELLSRSGIAPTEVENWGEFVNSTAKLAITTFPLELGLKLENPQLRLVTESQLFGHQVMQRRRRSRGKDNTDLIVRNLTELKVGSPVVHLDHGIGRYLGLQTLEVDGNPHEFLTLEYADNAKLYVPVTGLGLISRYSAGDEELAPLHRLGNEQWSRAKKKAAEQIRDTAAELLGIYAQRAARQGFAYTDPGVDYNRFCAEFPFEETPDQLDAIEAVHKDMLSPNPMDRLVCGDVGFGKTEVAMRAAFISVSNSRQVLMLVPTTLLAQQHFDNFRDRFANWPVTVDVVSRFKTAKEQESLLGRFQDGKTDILIGTHKLLHGKFSGKNLGLLVIDEEHRFGVQQKEKIKAMRAHVDILTLTATPIPRTLNMAMGGIRDLSIIATPPARRLSVKTFVRQYEQRVVREAILRELLRGGQVFYLHNEVKTIEKTADELKSMIPEARVAFAHGQMRERELEKVMTDVYHQRFNILVCTTIIETGIDIPSANTIIIERADKFGLAQLHQLRGRVGRSHHQAYAYMMTPEPKSMTNDAIKRLDALAEADHLGSGFTLATNDMEIRGAGELLGEGQSGHIHSIGFSLYMTMLDKAVASIKRGEEPDLEESMKSGTDIQLNIPALIPEDYLPDINSRLTLYKRLASTSNEEELRELQVEMIDRFGLLPEPTKCLIRITRLRQLAEALGITKIDGGSASVKVAFSAHTTVDPMTIVNLVQQQSDRYKLVGANELKMVSDMQSVESRLDSVTQMLDTLSQRN